MNLKNPKNILLTSLLSIGLVLAMPVAYIFAEEEVVEEVPVVEEVVVEEEPQEQVAEEQTQEVPEPVTEQAPEETPSADAVVETGDALAETDINNEVNTNSLTSSTTDITASSTNEALVENTSTTTAESGSNTATSTAGTAVITTGTTFASANIINVVNTNIFNSQGFIYLLNNFLGGLGNIDLRFFNIDLGLSVGVEGCDTFGCDATSTSLRTEITNSNDATITNDTVVRSSSGNNTAEGGDALIQTGNAYAAANVVNVANTNIVDSNYLVFAFNNFGNWDGDLVFNNSDFFQNFFNNSANNSGSNTNIENENDATVTNDIDTESDTGNNTTSGSTAVTETGDALANTNVHNEVNSNFFGTSNFILIFRIFGSWSGNIFNAPQGLSWTESENGLEIFDSGTGTNSGTGNTSISNNNTASINNNVKVLALTGQNKASGSSSASVNTGDAYAGSNIVNVANTNVVSSNWILAVVNIFGNWSGNISFGQPDLWVASRVEGPLQPGAEVTVYTTIANRGDAPAHNVIFNQDVGAQGLSYMERVGEDNELRFFTSRERNIPLLRPGQTIEYSYKAKIEDKLPYGDIFIPLNMKVTAEETDGNEADNSDELMLVVYNKPVFVAPLNLTSYTTTYPELGVEKWNNVSAPVQASSTINYTIKVTNGGGKAFESVLVDQLKDEGGNIISEQRWDLGTILEGEEITVTYVANFSSSTKPGTYVNYAWVEALGGDYMNHWGLADDANSPVASSSITIEAMSKNLEEGVVEETEGGIFIETQSSGTLRTGPQSSLRDDDSTNYSLALEFIIPKKAPLAFDMKKLIASVFSIVLFMRPRRENVKLMD